MDTIIKCENVSKTFSSKRGSVHVLDNITLDVKKNEFVSIIGPGQCGKTTLMNILAGLEPADSGTVYCNGKIVKEPSPERGVIFQSMALFPWFTVMENVVYGLKARGVKKSIWYEKAKYYIHLVGLDGFENSYINSLSGGMKQRVGIARAYCNEPEVLFMDEPFSALDAQTRYLMQDEIMRIWEKEKRTIVFVTNNIEEAVFLSDRIIMLSNCPAKVTFEYSEAELIRPRNYTDKDFLKLRDTVTKSMDKTL